MGWFSKDINKSLIKAVEYGKVEKVMELLQKGADINADYPGGTPKAPLYYALLKGHDEVVDLLLKMGAILTKEHILWADDKFDMNVLESIRKKQIANRK